jgi:hypothetical protein
MLLAALLLAIYVAGGTVSLWSHLQVRQFVAETPTIADQHCLERYKDLVRVQMYVALFIIGLLGTGALVGMVLVSRYGCIAFLFVMAGSVCLIASSLFMRTWEVRARSLAAGSEALAVEYRRVSEAWVKKPLPDF